MDTGVIPFVPVQMPTDFVDRSVSASKAMECVEIGLVGGWVLKVPSSLPMADLRRLIRAVEGA